MPWLFLKFGLPLVAGIGLIFLVHAHFVKHEELKLSNAEKTAELIAARKTNDIYRDEITKRDSIIARRDMAYQKLSRDIRQVKSVVSQSQDSSVRDWGNAALPDVVISGLRQVSVGPASDETNTTTDVTD